METVQAASACHGLEILHKCGRNLFWSQHVESDAEIVRSAPRRHQDNSYIFSFFAPERIRALRASKPHRRVRARNPAHHARMERKLPRHVGAAEFDGTTTDC